MAKCTGIRCPMQVGYIANECDYKDCPYRTEPITNADRIRAMSDKELAEFFDIYKPNKLPRLRVFSRVALPTRQRRLFRLREMRRRPKEMAPAASGIKS